MKKIQIFTLTYNQLENATKPYIESLYKYTDIDDFDLIIVDNASTDGTKEYLEEISKKYDNIRVIYNDENVGFSKGNNQCLKQTNPEIKYIGLFNNDILFTPNWLKNCIKVFEKNPKLGLSSPRINKMSQKVMTKDNYLSKYERYIGRFKEDFTKNLTNYFCCAIMTYEAFQNVGYLDENFSPAFFEDEDYCMRMHYKGYDVGYINTAFVFHNHQSSTGNMSKKWEILKKNREYFYKKHYLASIIYPRLEMDRKLLKRFKYAILGEKCL